MLRRNRNDQPQSVPVEAVELVDVDELVSNDPIGAGRPLSTPISDAGAVRGHRSEPSPPATPAAQPNQAPPTDRRSPRWPVVVLVVVLLGGVVFWVAGRGAEPSGDLPTLPRRPTERYSFTVDPAVLSEVSVAGTAQAAYVRSAHSLYALDGSGNLRWSVDLDAGSDGAGSDNSGSRWLSIDELIVAGTSRVLHDDNGTATGFETKLIAINPDDGEIEWQTASSGLVRRRVGDSLILEVHDPVAIVSGRSQPNQPAQQQAVQLQAVDLRSGARTERRFDRVAPEPYQRASSTAPLAVEAKGTVFFVGGDLSAITPPIPVGADAVFGSSDDRIAVIDAGIATLYDRDGGVVASTRLDAENAEHAEGSDATTPPLAITTIGDGNWWFGGVTVDDTGRTPSPYCRAVPFAPDNTVNGETTANAERTRCLEALVSTLADSDPEAALVFDYGALRSMSASSDEGTTSTESAILTVPGANLEPSSAGGGTIVRGDDVYEFEFDTESAGDETVVRGDDVYELEVELESANDGTEPGGDALDEAEQPSWNGITTSPPTTVPALNGYVANEGTNLVGTRLPDESTLFSLPLGPSSSWALLDGAIAIWEPDNSKLANAVKVTVYA